jgi:hypothetical protein
MFAFGITAIIGWNKESIKFLEQKQVNIELQHQVNLLDLELARINVTKDILAINEEVEAND